MYLPQNNREKNTMCVTALLTSGIPHAMYVLKLKYFWTEDIRISWLTSLSFGVVVEKFASNT